MQHLELTRKALEEQCSTWANNIKEVYQPDLIIYIAKGGYLIGKQMREVFQVPMIGVSTVRDGNGGEGKNRASCCYTSKLYSKPIDFD